MGTKDMAPNTDTSTRWKDVTIFLSIQGKTIPSTYMIGS